MRGIDPLDTELDWTPVKNLMANEKVLKQAVL
jgi:ribonuclease D